MAVLRCRALDWPFEIASDDLTVDAEVARVFGTLRDGRDDVERSRFELERVDGVLEVRQDGVALERGDVEACMRAVVLEANTTAVDLLDPPALHALAVAGPGGAVVLAGASGSGKSTTAATLVEHGWAYLSDEVAAFDEHGRVRPYPKPIGLDPGSPVPGWEAGGLVPPGELGEIAEGPAPVAVLGLLDARPGPAPVVPLERSTALAVLMGGLFGGTEEARARAFVVLAEVLRGATAVTVHRAPRHVMAQAISALVRADAGH